MHAKYEVSISYGSKVMAKIKVFFHRVTDRQTESQTHRQDKKLDAPEFHPRGHKKKLHVHVVVQLPLRNVLLQCNLAEFYEKIYAPFVCFFFKIKHM